MSNYAQRKGQGKQPLCFECPPELKEQIQKQAKVEDRSMSAMIRVALAAYLMRMSPLEQRD